MSHGSDFFVLVWTLMHAKRFLPRAMCGYSTDTLRTLGYFIPFPVGCQRKGNSCDTPECFPLQRTPPVTPIAQSMAGGHCQDSSVAVVNILPLSVQFSVESIRSEKPIYAPPRHSEVLYLQNANLLFFLLNFKSFWVFFGFFVFVRKHKRNCSCSIHLQRQHRLTVVTEIERLFSFLR